MSPGEFNFPEYANSSYASPTIAGFPDNLQNLQPIPAGHPGVYQGVHPQQNGYLPQGPRPAGDKRKADVLSPGRTFEEESRRAAEEDKRRRNTAASARFRVKKKQREQALEKSTKEMTEKVTNMENRISQLETENKWLKNIVLEKNGGNHDLLSKLLEDFHAKNQANGSNGSPGSDDDEVSNLRAPTSPEEREAGDSSG